MQESITGIAERIAEMLANKDEDTDSIYWQAVDRYGFAKLNTALLWAIARRAAVARSAGAHGIVCRLREAAYRYLPKGERELVRKLFAETGAVGHKPPVRQAPCLGSMLKAMMDPHFS